jgi:TonB-dependent starch-binding outer membrane protein SusC
MFQTFTRVREKCTLRLHFKIHQSLIFAAIFLLLAYQGVAQNFTIKGTVKDETGESLPGVSAVVKGTTLGTTTGSDGEYTLSAAQNSTFIFSCIVFDGGGFSQ